MPDLRVSPEKGFSFPLKGLFLLRIFFRRLSLLFSSGFYRFSSLGGSSGPLIFFGWAPLFFFGGNFFWASHFLTLLLIFSCGKPRFVCKPLFLALLMYYGETLLWEIIRGGVTLKEGFFYRPLI